MLWSKRRTGKDRLLQPQPPGRQGLSALPTCHLSLMAWERRCKCSIFWLYVCTTYFPALVFPEIWNHEPWEIKPTFCTLYSWHHPNYDWVYSTSYPRSTLILRTPTLWGPFLAGPRWDSASLLLILPSFTELFSEELADWPLVLLPNEPRDAVMRDDNWWNIVEFATYFLMKDVAPGMAPTMMAM